MIGRLSIGLSIFRILLAIVLFLGLPNFPHLAALCLLLILLSRIDELVHHPLFHKTEAEHFLELGSELLALVLTAIALTVQKAMHAANLTVIIILFTGAVTAHALERHSRAFKKFAFSIGERIGISMLYLALLLIIFEIAYAMFLLYVAIVILIAAVSFSLYKGLKQRFHH